MQEKESVSLLMRQTALCPMCNSEAEITISEYTLQHEALIIISLKCTYCSYRRSDVIPIVNENSERCIEVNVERSEDLNTILYVPQDTTITIPELGINIDAKELAAGSYLTVDGILFEVSEKLSIMCTDWKPGTSCVKVLEMISDVAKGNVRPLTLRLTNPYGNIKVVKAYRNNFKKC